MTFNIHYTSRTLTKSSAVGRVWYNEPKEDLYLELHGAVYLYANVPVRVVDALVTAPSVGRFYQDIIKRRYNPGSRLGPVSDLREIRATVYGNQDADVQVLAPVVSLRPQADVTTPSLSLVKDVVVPTSEKRRYEFAFTYDGGSSVFKHTLYAGSEDSALDALFELGDLLDREIDPVSATVYYD